MDKIEREINLVDLGFQNFSVEEKRETFMMLDIAMKKYHENGYAITSFDLKDIYYQSNMFGFSKVTRISPTNANDKNDAILKNVVTLANLAFCSYLPMYDLTNGLLNSEVVSKYFDKFENRFVPMDRGYYRSVLVDSIKNKKLPDIPYYYDYIEKVMQNTDLSNSSNSNVRAFMKATEAGRLMTDNNEAAFGTVFYFTCMVSSMLIAFAGLALYFLK